MNHSIDAEKYLLGAILLDNAAFDRVADILTPESFWHQPHGQVYTVMVAMIVAGQPVDVLTLFEAVRARGGAGECGSLSYLNELLQSVPSATNVRRYAEVIAAHAAGRAIAEAADAALAVARGAGAPAEKLDRIHGLFGALNQQQVRKAPRSLAAIAVERTEHYERLERGEVAAGWPTGFASLDTLLNGGVRPGGLYIVAARPKVGKSSFTQAVAKALAAQGLPTLLLSMEMPDVEVADRAVTMTGHVDYSALLSGKLDQEGWSRVTEALDRLASLPLFVDDSAGLTIEAVKAKARTIKGLKVLVIDYLQLMSGTKGDDNRNSQLETITRGLKTMAKTDGLAVVALSQLNREVEKRPGKRPQLSDLRDSGAIEQDADAVMLMWPARDLPAEGRRVIGMNIEANRQGPNGMVAFDFWGNRQRWAQSDADITAPAPRTRAAADDL